MELLALPSVCHVIYGSYMSANAKSDILAICVVLLNFLASFLGSLMMHTTVGIITKQAKVKRDGATYVWKTGTTRYFGVIPLGLGFVGNKIVFAWR